MRTFFIPLALVVASYLFVAGTARIFSSGSPAGNTGAPSEPTCSQAGCHGGGVGAGQVAITPAAAGYTPGGAAITITIQNNLSTGPTGWRGFQVTVLDGSNSPVGTLNVTDATNTKKVTASVAGNTREYITHTFTGHSLSQWTLSWTPPATDVGPVTFYAAGATDPSNGFPVHTAQATLNPITPPPSAPSGLTATPSDGSVQLSWNAVADAASYTVYRGTASPAAAVLQAGVTTTSLTDNAVVNGTTYFYRVTAVGPGGESGFSSEVSATPVSVPPLVDMVTFTPTNPQPSDAVTVTATVTDADNNLSDVEIIWRLDGTNQTEIGMANPSGTTFSGTLPAQPAGSTVAFSVRARDGVGNRTLSAEQSYTVQGPAPPSAPSGLMATPGDATVELLWNAVAGAASYTVYRGTASPAAAVLQAGITTTSLTDNAVVNGTTYFYRVTAVGPGGESGFSGEVSATPTAGSPVECAGIDVRDARSVANGAAVVVEGIVTRAMGRLVRLQDETGGIAVFQSSGLFFEAVAAGTLGEGDRVCITGARSDFNGLQQISPESFVVTQHNAGLPAPLVLTIPGIHADGENLESELIEIGALLIVGATTTQFQANTSYTARDPQGNEITFRVQSESDNALVGQPIPQERFRFTGVLGEFNGSYQLIPVHASDITADPQVGTEDPSVPGVFTLHAAYPNPFNPQATLSFDLERAARATLTVYDGLGRTVAVLVAKELPVGTHEAAFDASALPSGTYFYRLDAGGHARTRAFTLMK